MSAHYDPTTKTTYFMFAKDGSGYTFAFPSDWSIARVQRYASELELWVRL